LDSALHLVIAFIFPTKVNLEVQEFGKMESLYDFLIGAIVDTDLAIEGFATGA
jgi:hypothetical protein